MLVIFYFFVKPNEDNKIIFITFYVPQATNPGDPDYRTKAESYQADAISCIAQLNDSFWEEFHTWRLEWQPPNEKNPTEGYVKWYIDGEFKFEVSQANLNSVNLDSKIPMEPSSIVIIIS